MLLKFLSFCTLGYAQIQNKETSQNFQTFKIDHSLTPFSKPIDETSGDWIISDVTFGDEQNLVRKMVLDLHYEDSFALARVC